MSIYRLSFLQVAWLPFLELEGRCTETLDITFHPVCPGPQNDREHMLYRLAVSVNTASALCGHV